MGIWGKYCYMELQESGYYKNQDYNKDYYNKEKADSSDHNKLDSRKMTPG